MRQQPRDPNINAPDQESASPGIPIVYEEEQYHWEYKCIRQNIDEEDPLDETELNKLGKEGWELVTVFSQDDKNIHYYFRRLIS